MSDDKSPGIDYCIWHSEHCEKCPKRGCNKNTLRFEKSLSCFKCDPTETNDCNQVPENSNTTECAPVALGYKNECYIYQKNNLTHRGCLYDALSTSEDEIFTECLNQYSDRCYTCNNENGCNNNTVVFEDLNVKYLKSDLEDDSSETQTTLCYECDSRENPKCADLLDDSMIKPCPASEDDSGCFHKIDGNRLLYHS